MTLKAFIQRLNPSAWFLKDTQLIYVTRISTKYNSNMYHSNQFIS